MARASVRTLLPLDTFAKILGINPLHFNQVEVDTLSQATTCGSPFVQYAWQAADRIGREEIATAIQQAEQMIADQIGFNLLPTWDVEKPVNFLPAANPLIVNATGLNIQGKWQTLQADKAYIITGGQEAKSLILANVPVVYSDTDGDGYFETASIAVATTVTQTDEIAIYYPGEGGDDGWEIRPINVVIAGGIATITCRREQLLMGDLQEQFDPRGQDGLTNPNFLITVDVYRHYNDPSRQIQFVWDPEGSLCECNLPTCSICSYYAQYGCMHVRDTRLGIVAGTPGTWNATTGIFDYVPYIIGRQPDKARLWYLSGWEDKRQTKPRLQMDPTFARAVTYLAVGLLDRPLCNCDHIKALTAYWQDDLALTVPEHTYQLSSAITNNPLGTTRGAQYAWRLVQRYKVGNGVTYQ